MQTCIKHVLLGNKYKSWCPRVFMCDALFIGQILLLLLVFVDDDFT